MLGLKRYFTGIQCIHGHIDERKVNDGSCITCNRNKSRRHAAATKKWREDNRMRDANNKRNRYLDKRKEYLARSKKQRLENPERVKEYKRKWRKSEKGLQQSRDWTKGNLEKHKKSVLKYKKNNPGLILANTRKRQCAKLQRTPYWSDQKAIEQIYITAARITKETGILHHVDHVLPLQGKLVSGLHTVENLKIILATDNLKKSNTFYP